MVLPWNNCIGVKLSSILIISNKSLLWFTILVNFFKFSPYLWFGSYLLGRDEELEWFGVLKLLFVEHLIQVFTLTVKNWELKFWGWKL